MKKLTTSMVFILLLSLAAVLPAKAQENLPGGIRFIDFYYENASPLIWTNMGDTAIRVEFLYDYERGSSNRQSTHFNFKIHADPGTELNLVLSGFRNIYNGRVNTSYARIAGQSLSCYFSEDYEHWEGVHTTPVQENSFDHQVRYRMKSEVVYVAKLPVYTTAHLDKLTRRLQDVPQAEVFQTGTTVEGRPLEMIRLGNPDADNHILIRARSHSWEPGGNWVVEGLIQAILEEQPGTRAGRGSLCYHIMPMANKDMTVRGMTRFNVNGMDLNRGWGYEADSLLCPENYYLEQYVKKMIRENRKPAFLIDFHNDDYGNLHVSKAKEGDPAFQERMDRFYRLMTEDTWFSGRQQNVFTDDPARYSIAAGLYQRYDITGCVLELNGNWIGSLQKIPSAADWMELGRGMHGVFVRYFEER